MRRAGLQGLSGRRKWKRIRADDIASDRVERQFARTGPVSCGLPTSPSTPPLGLQAREGKVYCCAVLEHPLPELGVDPSATVDLMGLAVDLGDQVGQHRVADRALARSPLAVFVVAGLRDAQDLGRRPGPAGSPRPSPRWPRTGFWAGLLLQQLGRAATDRQLGLELGDPLLRRCQLGVLGGAQTRLQTTVDPVLAAPVVDRLVAEVEIVRDAGDALPPRAGPEPCVETPPSSPVVPSVLLDVRHQNPEIQTPWKQGHTRSPDTPGRFTALRYRAFNDSIAFVEQITVRISMS